jgi:ATP-dependent Clp protease ATP-binding subunit ClpA
VFDNFSARARQVVFVARFKAGERGATAIDVDDFIHALILEDQGMMASTFSNVYEGQGTLVNRAPSHVPFFSSEIAQGLLSNLERSLPQSQPVSLTTEIPLSASLETAFDSAKALQTRFQHKQIEPLHLLAAILAEELSRGVKLLQGSGITQENVLLMLSAGADS